MPRPPLLLLLASLGTSLGDIQGLIANCIDFRRCACARGISQGTPAMAHLTNTNTKTRCTAALINDRYLVSSADCAAGLDASQVQHDLVVTFLDTDEQLRVNSIFVHPDYVSASLPRLHDIMLVRLTQLVDMTVRVPVCLPHASLMMYEDAPAWVMAPGRRPHAVETHIGFCSFMHRVGGAVHTIRVRPGKFLCAGSVQAHFCSRQPGFLLAMRIHGWHMLLGVASTLEVFPMCSLSMGLFTEVLPYRAWIRNVTRGDSSDCQFVP